MKDKARAANDLGPVSSAALPSGKPATLPPSPNPSPAEPVSSAALPSGKPATLPPSPNPPPAATEIKGLFSRYFKTPNAPELVSDLQFLQDLEQLKELRSFLIREAVSLTAPDPESVSFKGLNNLRYGPAARSPTEEEWGQVESLTQTLFRILPPELRRKFVLGRIPMWITAVPVGLAAVAIISLVMAVLISATNMYGTSSAAALESDSALLTSSIGPRILPFYVVWLVCLGGIGAVAFIGMNALSVQADVTFDLMNTRLMILRIILGAMFGLVITLPFGFPYFTQFVTNIVLGKKDKY
jgi:NO-binding membrane sensor protein with MHYT domain